MVIPRPVEGRFRKLKSQISVVLFLLLLVMPFLRWNGNPVLLLDIPSRTFHIFGLTIWPQELYFLHVILIIAGISLFFFTALFGRIWCGYACPQTLFVELYDRVARLVAGKSYGRPTAKKSDWVKIYSAWLLLSLALSFVYVSYFVPYEDVISRALAADFFPEGGTIPHFWVIFFVSATAFSMGNAAYFRENVCRYVCPYGRFQAALLDQHSPIVHYDPVRGEPRREKKQKVGAHDGDCIDCGMCTAVCPTGIDIREGLQVGCIACGLCVDACTSVLAKYDKPTLIDYRTIEQTERPDAKRPYARPRTIVYGILLMVAIGTFVFLLSERVPLYASVVRDRAISNIFIPGIGYQNGYELHVGNMSYKPIQVRVSVPEEMNYELIAPAEVFNIEAEGYEKIRLIVRHGEDVESNQSNAQPLVFHVQNVEKPSDSRAVETVFSYPER